MKHGLLFEDCDRLPSAQPAARMPRLDTVSACRLFMQAYAERACEELREYFWIVPLNKQLRTLVEEPIVVSIGSLDATVVHPRDTFRHAMLHNAYGVLLCHNHPGGSATPSPEDMALTRRLVAAGDILGIRVVDHLILTADPWEHYSFADHGRLADTTLLR